MDFTEVMKSLKNASAYDLYRIKTAIENEIESPEKIKIMRQCFAVGDQITYFDSTKNSLVHAFVLDKKLKNVRVRNLCDQKIWLLPYYMINLTGKQSDIHTMPREKPTKNNFKIGDSVGFDNDGTQCFGIITKLNHKTASLITRDNKRWRVGYGILYKVLEGDLADQTLNISQETSGRLIEL